MMRSLIKALIFQAAQNEIAWSLLDGSLIRVAKYATTVRRTTEAARRQSNPTVREAFLSGLSALRVKHGPFQGMRYPEGQALNGALVPKIIGSYESELHLVMEEICANAYGTIVNIGCAEGYYAVGLAMRIPNATVFAYDTMGEAIRLCQSMAELNNVAHRVITGAFCSASTLRSLPLGKRALIISDCEGYEKVLFDPDTVALLASHDFLIELHDFIDIEISPLIRQRFQATHVIRSVRSIDDIQKAHSYLYPELDNYDLLSRKQLLGERRPSIMEWYYMTPRTRETRNGKNTPTDPAS
jgi:hypothetical protein